MTRAKLPVALVAVLLALPLVAGAAGAEEGNVCDVPRFDFAWPDSVNPDLVVEVKRPGVFSIEIIGRDSDWNDKSVKVRKRHYHPGANRVRKDFTALDLYLSNTVTVKYKGYEVDDHGSQDGVCEERKHGEVQLVVFERQLLKIDLGSVFARNKDDGFDSSPEIAVNATSRWKPRLTGVVDIRLSKLAQLEEAPETGETGEDEPADEAKEDDVFNPFTESGSLVSGNFYLIWHPWPLNRADKQLYPPPLGILAGGGFSTFSGDSDSVEARKRFFTGVRLQVQGYNRKKTPEKLGGSTGFIQVGVADDELWKFQTLEDHDNDPDTEMIAFDQDESERFFVEAALEFPNLGGEKGRLAIRVFADLPQSGDGPSDLRFSVLAAIDLKALGKAIGTGG